MLSTGEAKGGFQKLKLYLRLKLATVWRSLVCTERYECFVALYFVIAPVEEADKLDWLNEDIIAFIK